MQSIITQYTFFPWNLLKNGIESIVLMGWCIIRIGHYCILLPKWYISILAIIKPLFFISMEMEKENQRMMVTIDETFVLKFYALYTMQGCENDCLAHIFISNIVDIIRTNRSNFTSVRTAHSTTVVTHKFIFDFIVKTSLLFYATKTVCPLCNNHFWNGNFKWIAHSLCVLRKYERIVFICLKSAVHICVKWHSLPGSLLCISINIIAFSQLSIHPDA